MLQNKNCDLKCENMSLSNTWVWNGTVPEIGWRSLSCIVPQINISDINVHICYWTKTFNALNSCKISKDINKPKNPPQNQFVYELLAVNEGHVSHWYQEQIYRQSWVKHYVCLSGQKSIELQYDAAEIFVVVHIALVLLVYWIEW